MIGLILALCVLSVPVAADISGISPNHGPTTGGTTVTISGDNFDFSPSETYHANFGNDWVNCVWVDSNHLSATTLPHLAGSVPVTVTYFFDFFTVPGQTSFTYDVPTTAPTFSSIDPASGTYLGDTAVKIEGSNFVNGVSLGVTIGGVVATSVSVTDSTHIAATTPPGTVGPQNVVITNGDGQTVTANGAYTYTSWAVTGISPNSGPTAGGTPVTISGEGFLSDDKPYSATFDPTLVQCMFVDSKMLTATTPPHAAGTVTVYVNNGMGFSHPTTFTYTDTIPSPEFPSAFLPATMIIGFLGAVLLIQRTREH